MLFSYALQNYAQVSNTILLQLSWKILISECSITLFQYNVTVLLESINLWSYI